MSDDVEDPWSKKQTWFMVAGFALFVVGVLQAAVRPLSAGLTGPEFWFWVVLGAIQAVCGAGMALGVLRQRRDSPRRAQRRD